MGIVLQSTLTAIASVVFIMGNLGNGLIALVNCTDWVKRRKISPVDQLLTALAISRIALHWVVFLDWWVSIGGYPAFQMTGNILRMVYITWTVTNHFNLWFTTSLSIFYFLKIVNFSNRVFLYLKFRVGKVVSMTLLVSLFLLCLNILSIKTYADMLVDGVQRNISYSSSLDNTAQWKKLLSFINPVFMFIPFTVSLTTFLLLVVSLRKHLGKMQHSTPGCRDASTVAHLRALKTVIASILLYVIFILSLLVKVWISELHEPYLVFLCFRALGITVLSAHSFVLILGSRRLRRASLSVVWWLRYRFQNEE